MPVYEYRALDSSGKTRKGILDADSPVAARHKLRGTGMFPVEIKETTSKLKTGFSVLSSHFFSLRRVSPGEVYAATRQLSTLLGAGVPLVASLDSLLSQNTGSALKRSLAQIKESVNQGNSLAFSLSEHPKLFSEVYINMVRAGEESGSLDVVLERLAEFGEHQEALKGRFKAALVYPIFMSVIGAGVLFFLITFIVPGITRIFVEMEETLPLPTIILIGISNFLKSFWWAIFIALLGIIMVIRQIIKRPGGRHLWDEFRLRIPIFGPITQKIALARFARTLGSLIRSGVSLLSSLKIVRNIVNNVLIAEVVDKSVEEIQAGKSMADSLSSSRWFPPMVVQMISVGEHSGNLENMLNKTADFYETETESNVMALTSMMEPVMILIMGLIIAFIVVSILLPIFEMSQMIR